MYLLVGLGNPGKKYAQSRHNVGWMVIDELFPEADWRHSTKANADFTKTEFVGDILELLKPHTFMNNSGQAVAYAAKNHDIPASNIIVIQDDLDLPIGKIRISQGGGHGGHNGIKSIQQHLKSKDFVQIKIGIARTGRMGMAKKPKGNWFVNKKQAVSNFVLARTPKAEQRQLLDLVPHITIALEHIIKNGAVAANEQLQQRLKHI